MKKFFYLVFYALLLCSCGNPQESNVPYYGWLTGEIKYTGASNMGVDNVIITLTGVADNEEDISKRITNDGKYNLELPAGTYTMDLKGNRCASDDLPFTVKIVAKETRTKDINIEQLSYSVVLSIREGEELKDGSTISIGDAQPLHVWNKYSSNTLSWHINAYSDSPWITFSKTTGTTNGGGSDDVTIITDKSKMSYGLNSATVVLSAEEDNEGRGYQITVQAEKEGGEPGKAEVLGDKENRCPDESVILTASAQEATSYKWYKGNTLQNGANGNTFEVNSNGVYYAVGVNSRGEGVKSDGKTVTITSCPDPPTRAVISGNAANDCSRDGQQVTLTASAAGAERYIWRRDSEQLPDVGNKLIVKDIGTHTYYAIGVNSSGEGQESYGKTVSISSCVPGTPSGLSANVDVTGSRLKLSWNYATSATRYRVQRCSNVSMTGCEGSGYFKETSSTPEIYIEESALSCGMNYFRVISVNDYGESPNAATVSYNHVLSISTSWYYLVNMGFLSWSSPPNVIGVHSKPTIYYDISRKIGDGEWKIIGTTTGTYYDDDTYSLGDPTRYKIRAYVTTRCGVAENYGAEW